jgi:broad specificity phosphatase PhoE
MGRIILVQHCQSEHHINDMSGGWTDTPLTDLGRKQAEQIGLKLKERINSNDCILYSSDLLRASQTAEIIGRHLELETTKNSGLREINTGVATGKTKEWAKANRKPRTGDVFNIDHQEFEEGETARQFYARVCGCIDGIYASDNDKDLVIVTHGGTVAYIVSWWMNFPPEVLPKTHFSSSVASISILSKNLFGQNALILFNDTSHLSLLR